MYSIFIKEKIDWIGLIFLSVKINVFLLMELELELGCPEMYKLHGAK